MERSSKKEFDESSREGEEGTVCTSNSSATSNSDNESFLKNAHSAKKRLSHYYKKQNEILDHYKQDSEQIEAARRSKERQRELRMSESNSSESGANLVVVDGELSPSRKEDGSMRSKDSLLDRHEAAKIEEKALERAAARLAFMTLIVNLVLMLAKITAAYMSGSMSIISSMTDSIVDLTSGFLLSVSSRLIRHRDPYEYPRGRTRVEPLALILISVIMGMASVVLIIQSVGRITETYSDGVEQEIDVSWPTIGIMLTTITVKLALYCICKKYKRNASIRVLSLDHRNDCISNSVALACAWVAFHYGVRNGAPTGVSLFGMCPNDGCNLYYFDPVGAIIVSVYILYTWIRTGYAHFLMLSGRSASPELINRIIKQCIEHDVRITHLDTVYVYYYGTKFIVEVHIVMDREMRLKDTHDIAESLQNGIEALPEIERAFVHCDYEYEHHPEDEHKAV